MPRPRPPKGLAAVRIAARATVAGAPRGRRRIGLLVLVFLPVVVTAIVLMVGEGGRGSGFTSFSSILTHAYLGRILPLALIFLGTATFGDEWAAGTACYVLGLPISRRALVVGRWLACVRRALVIVLPAVTALYVICLIPFGDAWLEYLPALGSILAVMAALTCAYSAVFVLFGLALTRAVMTSLFYVFVSEMVFSHLPQALAVVSLDFHARNLIWQLTSNDVFKPITVETGVAVEPVGLGISLLWIAGFCVGALALSTLVLARKEAGGEAQAAASAET